MDIWKHCLMSQRKFGGQPADYFAIHQFIDSSKLFHFHAKHRALLHNLYGIELTCERFSDRLTNSQGRVILVRDIAAEHCKEDLSGHVPGLFDWFNEMDSTLAPLIVVPDLSDTPDLESFVMRPYLRSGLHSSLLVTCSDFGIYLAELFLGFAAGKTLADRLPARQRVKELLRQFRFTQRWQYTPMLEELQWLKQQEAQLESATPAARLLHVGRSAHGQEEGKHEESELQEGELQESRTKESRSPKGGSPKNNGKANNGQKVDSQKSRREKVSASQSRPQEVRKRKR